MHNTYLHASPCAHQLCALVAGAAACEPTTGSEFTAGMRWPAVPPEAALAQIQMSLICVRMCVCIYIYICICIHTYIYI